MITTSSSIYVFLLTLSLCTSYYLSPNHLTWDESSLFCQNWCKSELASIHNKSQNDEMINVIKSGYSGNSQSDAVFIGLHDDETISNFQWIDETPFNFGNKFYEYPWLSLPPQPDSIDNINCVQIRVNNNYGWDDTACSRERRFICNKCSGKLNKYIILKHEYDYTEANIQCEKQIGTTLAYVYSKRDWFELYSLCILYNKPIDCWIQYANSNIDTVDDKTIDYSNLLLQYPSNNKQFIRTNMNHISVYNADVNTVAHAICNIPSELCTKNSKFIAVNGEIKISHDCNAELLLSKNNGRFDGIINKQYNNEDRIVLIDYLFKMNDNYNGRGGIIIPITTCFAYYIGVSLNDNNQQLFVQYIQYNGSNTNYNIMPFASTNLRDAFNSTVYHLLSIKVEQMFERVTFTVSLNNDNILICEHLSELDLYSISVGIWSENSIIYGKSLYVSGTAINSQISDPKLPICILSANSIIKPYGIHISITFNDKLNINNTNFMIAIIKDITHKLIINTNIPLDCIDSDNLNIESQNKHNQTIINASIFVCTETQQQQLFTILNTNQYIKTQIINDINQQYGLHIQSNSTYFETDIIYINYIFNTTKEISIINDINSKSYVENYKTDNDMNILLIIIVGILASTAVFIACVLLGLNCLKIYYQFEVNSGNIEMNIYETSNVIASPIMSNISTIIAECNGETQQHVLSVPRKKLRSLYSQTSNGVTWEHVMGDVNVGHHSDDEVLNESFEEEAMITGGNISLQTDEIIRPYIVDNSTVVNSVFCGKDIQTIGDEMETPKVTVPTRKTKYAMV